MSVRRTKPKKPISVNGAVKSICDIMRRSNVAGAMNYVPELTWILFLRILDEREAHEAEEADIGQRRRKIHLRHHAPLQRGRRDELCPRVDLDPLSPHPR